MATKRLRIFAGPNGSGKSTFIVKVQNAPPSPTFKLGHYINADDIEKVLRLNHVFDFEQFDIKVTTKQIQSYFLRSKFSPIKLQNHELWKSFSVEENRLIIKKSQKLNSYIAADLAEFIRQRLLKANSSFSYETVMSDKRKISFLKKAKKENYKIYLYYFATEDPLININRVEVRFAQKGHNVDKEVIKKRYYKSLQNLKAAVKLTDRAYLFDNSQKASVLISEISEGKMVNIIDPQKIPNWFVKYLISAK